MEMYGQWVQIRFIVSAQTDKWPEKSQLLRFLRIILSSLLLFIKIRRGLYGWGRPKTDCTDTTKTIINSYPWSSLHKTERICVIFAASKKICVEIYGSEPKTDFSSMTIQITATYNIGSMQKMSNPDWPIMRSILFIKAGVTLCGSALSSEGSVTPAWPKIISTTW